MRSVFFFVFIFAIGQLLGQKKLPVKKQLKEYEIIKESLNSHFIGIDNYLTRKQVDSLFQDLRIKLMKPNTTVELYRIYSHFLAQFNDGHTQVQSSPGLFNRFCFSETTLPFAIGADDSSFYSLEHYYYNGMEVYYHDRILSINGKTFEEYANEMAANYSSDAKISSFQRRAFQRNFQYYYFLNYPIPEYFKVKMVHKNDTISTMFYPNPPSYRVISDLNHLSELTQKKDYGYLLLNEKHRFAYLKFESFFNSNGLEYKLKLEEHFNRIKENNTEYLIIDLRDNLGGKFQTDLLGHLFEKPTAICNIYFSAMQKPKYKKHMTKSPMYQLYNLMRVKSIMKGAEPVHRYMTKQKSNVFDGKVILLTNGHTFSSSTNVSSVLKYKRNATIIGDTGGGHPIKSCTGLINLKLPYSKLRMVVNPFYFEHQIDSVPNQPELGIQPDIKAPFFVNSPHDEALEKAVELIIKEGSLNQPTISE